MDIDDDDDGILDIDEGDRTVDTDNDGIWDSLDIDSDNDGITDNVEWQSTLAEGGDNDYIFPTGIDANGNGWDAAYDPDEAGVYYEAWDTDFDGTPDYLDLDSDADEIADIIEGNDANSDGIADFMPSGVDTDNDGLDDIYDTITGWSVPFNETGSNSPLQDTPDDDGIQDGVRDWRDNDPIPGEEDPTQECELFVPNGFSPNYDGINDYFVIDCIQNYPNLKIVIFNRWGNKVYDKENYGNIDSWGSIDAWWDGTSNNGWTVGKDKLPAGTYYYILYFNDGTKEPKAGYVFLNR